MKAKVLAAPTQMARLISLLLNATGDPRPVWFPVVPKRARTGRGQCSLPPGAGGHGWPNTAPGTPEVSRSGARFDARSGGTTPPPTSCDSKRDRGDILVATSQQSSLVAPLHPMRVPSMEHGSQQCDTRLPPAVDPPKSASSRPLRSRKETMADPGYARVFRFVLSSKTTPLGAVDRANA
jgi:hypothetical protein